MPDRLRLLVVDDDALSRRAVVRALSDGQPAITVEECDRPEQVLERLREPFDCAFVDYLLPGKDGLALLREARSAGIRTPIIILTAVGDEALAVEAMKAGAADYLPKSRVTPEVLRQSARYAQRLHRADEQAAAAEARLRANEERLSEAQALAHLGNYEFTVPEGQTLWSEETFRIVGRDRSRGEPSRAEYLKRVVHPDDVALSTTSIAQAVSDKTPFNYEYRIVREDGSIRHIHSVGRPILDEHGQVVRVFGTIMDITERKQIEQALRDSTQRLAALIQACPLGIFAMDLEDNIQIWTPAAHRIFGFSEQEVLGRYVRQFVPLSVRPDHVELRQRALSIGITGVELRLPRKDGTMVDVSLSAAPIRDAAGQRIGQIGIIEDITEAKRLKEQLLSAHRMETVGRLAGGVAHDFNNLLAVISGYTESLLRRMPAGNPLREHALEIQRAADRGANLTKQLLAFSRRQIVEPQVLDLNQAIRGVHQMLRRVISRKISIELALDNEKAPIRGDPGQIEQVLVNLALNARDAMPDGGHLTILTTHQDLNTPSPDQDLLPGHYVRLEVRDTGCGMDEEVRSRIFEPFYTTKQGHGTGLGLSIVYGIVQQCGGSITVRSEPGKGSDFVILFPAALAKGPGLEAQP